MALWWIINASWLIWTYQCTPWVGEIHYMLDEPRWIELPVLAAFLMRWENYVNIMAADSYWHHQSIGGHDVDHVMRGCPFPPWQWMAITYNVSVSKNDIKCKLFLIYSVQTFQHIQCPVTTTRSLNVRLYGLILVDNSELLSVFADIKF